MEPNAGMWGRLKEWMAGPPAEPLSVWETLGEEFWQGQDPPPDSSYAAALRIWHERRKTWNDLGRPGHGVAKDELDRAEAVFTDLVLKLLHTGRRSALCFSGGGIRSATFGLGVLQGLAAHSFSAESPDAAPTLLADVDYVSTVSGGGYLGAWFSAWARRHPEGATGIIRELAYPAKSAFEPEPQPLRHLRRFVNYLNPQLGAFSADTWTLVATVLRNILLNWLVMLPLLAAVLVLPRVFFALVGDFPAIAYNWVLYGSAALLAISVAYMAIDLPSGGDACLPQSRFLIFGLAPLFLSAAGFCLYWAWQVDLRFVPSNFIFSGIAIMAAGFLLAGVFLYWKSRAFRVLWMLQGAAFALITGAVAGLCTWWSTWLFTDPANRYIYSERVYAWLSIPVMLGIVTLAHSLLVAITSTVANDEDREWWARATAWIFIVIVCCVVFSGIVLMTPPALAWLPSIQWQAMGTAAAGLIVSRLSASPSVGATREAEERTKTSSAAGFVAYLAPKLIVPVFLVLLAGLIATFNDRASLMLSAWLRQPPLWSPFAPVPQPNPVFVELLLMLLMAVPALLLSRLIDANKFSLHAMYRSRLIRTFLGASNSERRPNPFTGFDPRDNIPMSDLPKRPLHVVNCTLNLVKGENLAWQQRKAEAFTATRYRVGSCRLGYQSTARYAGDFTLGGAITTSGAAANPNMGYASSPLLSIVMMLFNARLGAWFANPGEPGRGNWFRTGPTFSVRPFVDEAFGLTNDTNTWVNLSDGGHFENLGLYEMVLRRCRTIIVVDGSADPSFHFDDLGNAVRKIRVDMGIPIFFPHGLPIAKQITPGSRHCAVGEIQYGAVDGPDVENGTLIYIKTSLTGNEPRDVLNYAAQNPAFPHQPTSDQWFDESQFESYRRLGYHVVEEIFGFHERACRIDEFVEQARSYASAAPVQPLPAAAD